MTFYADLATLFFSTANPRRLNRFTTSESSPDVRGVSETGRRTVGRQFSHSVDDRNRYWSLINYETFGLVNARLDTCIAKAS